MIIIPKKNFLEAELSANTGLSGRFMLTKYKADSNGQPIADSAVVVADWFDNIITNQGLNRIGTNSDWLDAVQVGSGTATPQATDTGLQTFVAGTSTNQSFAFSAQSTPPYFATFTRTRRFAVGAAAGNLSEVGVGWATTGSTLFSRALILDGSGNPTTITVLADEVLDVTYQLRTYPPANDVSGSITVTGVGTIATTTRAAFVTSTTWASDGTVGGIHNPSIFSGSIGAITDSPSGSSSQVSATNNTYSNNSLQMTASATWGLNNGNFSVNSLLFRLGANDSNQMGVMQVGFGTPIPKTSSNTLTLNFTHTWARRVI